MISIMRYENVFWTYSLKQNISIIELLITYFKAIQVFIVQFFNLPLFMRCKISLNQI